jgi:nucleotide-binding universal stress UspA family protein
MIVMAGSTTGDVARGSGLDPQPGRFAVEPVDVAQVLVPLDGSPFAERALPVAAWLSLALAVDTHLVAVVPSAVGASAEAAIRYLDRVARSQPVAIWNVVERDDIGAALADAVEGPSSRLPCLATHGRGHSLPLGSVAVYILEHGGRPIVLVGPGARVAAAQDAPIVVAVDGTRSDDVLLPVALGWAARLRRPLEVVTVAEPAPPGYRDPGRVRRARGPARPERYVESLAARAEGRGVAVTGSVVYDPVSVQDGLVSFLDRTASLVVLGTRHRGLGRIVLGSDAVRVVHDAAVPALVVPVPQHT